MQRVKKNAVDGNLNLKEPHQPFKDLKKHCLLSLSCHQVVKQSIAIFYPSPRSIFCYFNGALYRLFNAPTYVAAKPVR